MSNEESKREPSQGTPERTKPGTSTASQQRRSEDTGKPLPFDDAGGSEDVVETSDPQKPPIDLERF